MLEIRVPRLGWSMETGTFVRWLRQPGESVRVGEPLFEIEGEKALQEVEAIAEGILRLHPGAPKPGSEVPVGALLGYLAGEGEALPWESSAGAAAVDGPGGVESGLAQAVAKAYSLGAAPSPSRAIGESRAVVSKVPSETSRGVATPRAKRAAKRLGVDVKALQGTGRRGRVREGDVVRAARERASREGATAGERFPLSGRRRVIAERLSEGWRRVVPATISSRADATELVCLRRRWKAECDPLPTYQDVVSKIVAQALKAHRLLAGRWEGGEVVLPGEDGIHLGLAVDAPEGLIVPVLRDVLRRPLKELAVESARILERARQGRLTREETQGAVFTISNLGGLGIDTFTPVIHFPETAILGLGAIRREAVVLDDDRIVPRHRVTLSLTFDHRVLDGAPAARFLQTVTRAIENPTASGLDFSG